MSTLTTIQSTDLITNSRADINDNFSALNTDKMETSVLDTDTTLAANSDAKVATQKAVKAYVDGSSLGNASTTSRGVVEIATDAESVAGTATGSSGALLVVPTTYLFNKAKLRVAKSGTQTVASTTAQVTFDTEDFDVGANFATNAFTTPRTGYYLVSFMTNYDSNASTTEPTAFEVRVDGVAVLRGANTSASNTSGESYNVSVTGLLSLTALQVVTVYCITSSHTATILATTNTKLSILEI